MRGSQVVTLEEVAAEMPSKWERRALWLLTFILFLVATGSCDAKRPLVCNPLIIFTCEPCKAT
jgi:hypothetical protein